MNAFRAPIGGTDILACAPRRLTARVRPSERASKSLRTASSASVTSAPCRPHHPRSLPSCQIQRPCVSRRICATQGETGPQTFCAPDKPSRSGAVLRRRPPPFIAQSLLPRPSPWWRDIINRILAETRRRGAELTRLRRRFLHANGPSPANCTASCLRASHRDVSSRLIPSHPRLYHHPASHRIASFLSLVVSPPAPAPLPKALSSAGIGGARG